MISTSQQVLDAATTAISLPQNQRDEFFGNLFKHDLHLRTEVFRLVKSHEENLARSLSVRRTNRVAPVTNDLFTEIQSFEPEMADEVRTLAAVSANSSANARFSFRSDQPAPFSRRHRAAVAIATLASMLMFATSIAGTLLVTNHRANSELSIVTRDLTDNAKRLEMAESQFREMQIRKMQIRESAVVRQASLPPAVWR